MSIHSPVVLSICIPTFNRCRYLENLLSEVSASISKLGFNYEILIGDNCSSDETYSICERFCSDLNLKYIRRDSNIGASANLKDLYHRASGEYLMYLADDDLPIFEEISDAICFLARHPEIGCFYAPWMLYDRVNQNELRSFDLSQSQMIEKQDFPTLLGFLIDNHIFPEIFIIRRELIYKSYLADVDEAFWAFVFIATVLQESAVFFSPRPFYKFVTRYFENETRVNAGNEEAKRRWDVYRGGLEFILARFSSFLPTEQLERWSVLIDQFATERMSIALRLRTKSGESWISDYLLANRIMSRWGEKGLPASYFLYRLNAAHEYLLSLGDSRSGIYKLAYFKSAPLEIIKYAAEFSLSNFRVLSDTIPDESSDFLVVLPESGYAVHSDHQPKMRFIRETELLALFP